MGLSTFLSIHLYNIFNLFWRCIAAFHSVELFFEYLTRIWKPRLLTEVLFVRIGFHGSFAVAGQILDLALSNIYQPIIDKTFKKV